MPCDATLRSLRLPCELCVKFIITKYAVHTVITGKAQQPDTKF